MKVGAQTETELKEKKLRVEDALNATKVTTAQVKIPTVILSLNMGIEYYVLLLMILPYTQAAVEEGIVVGGGCTLLRLAAKVDAIKETLENDEEKVGFV